MLILTILIWVHPRNINITFKSNPCSDLREVKNMILHCHILVGWLVGCILHQQGGHLKAVPPFTIPCERREDRFLHRSHW